MDILMKKRDAAFEKRLEAVLAELKERAYMMRVDGDKMEIEAFEDGYMVTIKKWRLPCCLK